MTSPLDTVFDAVAYDIVKALGKKVTFTQTTTTFDPATDSQTDVSVDYTVKVSPPARYKKSQVDGTNIRIRDTSVIVPSKNLKFTPERDMKVTIDTNVFTVIDIVEMYSGDSVAAYKLQLR